MKRSPNANAAICAVVSLVAFSGVPATMLHPGPLGPLPIAGSLLVGLIFARYAYRQWRNQTIEIEILFSAAAIGLPAFFVPPSTLPTAIQIGWAACFLICAVVGLAAWAFEQHE
ncbi:hypothetical protein [Burkholderia anthina]|uniref:hypothetical protein n=1 Tax=Burkholderia anthina TaxID=179879 RepID=UPI00158B7DEF|nr:hypothetical protein [Burkholderia anthina]